MFRRDSKLAIPLANAGSPSFLVNNLSASNVDTLAFSRLNEVHVIQSNGNSVMKFIMDKTRIYQVAFANLLGKSVLVVVSSVGVQVWSGSGNKIIFHFPLSSLPYFAESVEEKFMRGIASTPNFLCVGTSIGTVHAFQVEHLGGDALELMLAFSLEPDHHPVTSISSYENIIAAANDSGAIFGYSASEAFLQIFSFSGYGFPCTSLVQRENVLFAAYSSGHIRVFRTDIQELAIEVTAHTRTITGLSLHPQLNILVSCSQDQYIHVWEVPDFLSPSSRDISIIYSDLVENRICTGVTFLSGDSICVATYDDDDLVVYSKDK